MRSILSLVQHPPKKVKPNHLRGRKDRLVGRNPSLSDPDRGNLKFHTDFRSVYATALEKWLATPSVPILGQQFDLVDCLQV